MAEAIVGFVTERLKDFIMKKAELLGGVGNQIKLVETELIRIQCYLKDADTKRRRRRKGDAESSQVENWLNELRDVAYRIEDAVDTFLLEFDDEDKRDDIQLLEENKFSLQKIMICCFQQLVVVFDKLKNLGNEVMKVPGLNKLATELEEIQKKLDDLFKSKDNYGIQPLQDDCHVPVGDIVLSYRRAAYQDVDDAEVVGLDSDKNNILQLLRNREETPRRAVITIVGPGGLGKTTLARIVYNSAKENFDYHIMLSVSQQFNLIDLLRKMLSEIVRPDLLENKDVGYYISELNKLLSGKKYLIILDDVWGVELWNQLKYALPDNKNGCRVLMTSRFTDVAKSADLGMKPYELAMLNNKESLNLLLKKALPYHQEPNKECPDDMLELANTLSKKCKGLPLGLIVLGGILSMRDPTYYDWKKVLDTMDWFEEGKDCFNILALSYDDLPYYLKPCFLYLASFSEDYKIPAKCLIRMWVAEGFIPQQGTKSLEQAAEDFLEQLLRRSMVQVTKRYTNGSIKYCRVHDLLRDLAMHEAGKENFLTIFHEPKPQDVNHLNRVTRRASFQSDDCGEFINFIGPNIRSLLLFSPNISEFIQHSKFGLLRVVAIVCGRGFELKGLDRLIHLKYLKITNSTDFLAYFPDDFSWGRLKNLETLEYICNASFLVTRKNSLNDLWTIGTLRHVIIYDVEGPPANADLKNLQTLKGVDVRATWNENQLPHLNNLRKLELHINDNKANWDGLVHLLRTLPNLLSLKIIASFTEIPQEIVYPRVLPNYQNLETLWLIGKWCKDVTLEAHLFPPHLSKLVLENSQLNQDPMPELDKLKGIKKLKTSGLVKQKSGPSIFRIRMDGARNIKASVRAERKK